MINYRTGIWINARSKGHCEVEGRVYTTFDEAVRATNVNQHGRQMESRIILVMTSDGYRGKGRKNHILYKENGQFIAEFTELEDAIKRLTFLEDTDPSKARKKKVIEERNKEETSARKLADYAHLTNPNYGAW